MSMDTKRKSKRKEQAAGKQNRKQEQQQRRIKQTSESDLAADGSSPASAGAQLCAACAAGDIAVVEALVEVSATEIDAIHAAGSNSTCKSLPWLSGRSGLVAWLQRPGWLEAAA